MSVVCSLQRRPVIDHRALSQLIIETGLSPLEAQLLSSRGDLGAHSPALPILLTTPMRDMASAAMRLHEAIEAQEQVVVIADYDCDGATSCAVAVAGLTELGAKIGYVVPDRMVHGYGISPSVVDLALDHYPNARVILTVDNGILGHAGISYAAGKGLAVIVTDHHLPGDTLPSEALAVIDPAREDCPSGLQKLAGVGVALWMVAAVKRLRTAFGMQTPSLNFLLPYVAVGTVADMVGLDVANRKLVSAGLDAMRRGNVPVGIQALINEAGCVPAYITTQDIGFGLGPRINAAGRLDTMDSGIELLLTRDEKKARQLAKLLTETNDERKRLQKEAVDDASLVLDFTFTEDTLAIVKGSPNWHPGIVGLVASRIKEKHHRPTFVFSLHDGVAKGSGRSIPGFHLKDALEEVARRAPGVLSKFGGHAMAAGATLENVGALEAFERAFIDVAKERVTPEMLENTLWSDGPMPNLSVEDAARVLRHPWGQGFEAPAFDDAAVIKEVQPLGSSGLHWKIRAKIGDNDVPETVVMFNQPEPTVGQEVQMYLAPSLNTWKGKTSLQWQGRVLN
ncbi:single-stranded-DNA-specific exonuclease [Novimethylophilus kurashikiensis]|uniref:Single-stranded-DNA-specific exonuclease RecJ n=1 Tax=Novimethylophilus kurashikiensis TaxID=1825523 RepID=A0A2R5F855_9PROT|nr:DHHA1 domain-containing protein [Novimethylophilus kurashikiensis]GBG14377.1 single-stranded-DNA-specific exonuclease [Novimethylophilus kurashikiensis]